ncbi:MAG: glycine zipper 2TM domain-containing protein [Pseudomonadota bacterium]|nr:glycine zipper 2TM domain-containing protein [Pseudomonadota bacterium]
MPMPRLMILLLIGLLALAPAFARPPPWAPAHGYRDKHPEENYTPQAPPGQRAVIDDGRCNYQAAGAVLGAAVGGTLGASVGDGDGRTVAIIAGTVIGAILGSEVGRRLDETDRYCIGQTLEHADDGQIVTWRNPDSGGGYAVTPLRTFDAAGQPCREYAATVDLGGRSERVVRTACRQPEGWWRISR